MAAMTAEFLVMNLQVIYGSADLTSPIVSLKYFSAEFLIFLSVQNDAWCFLTAERALYAHSRAS